MNIKSIARVGVFICITALVWFLFESLVFTIEYGWHLQPVNKTEKICDYIGNMGFSLGVIIVTVAAYLKLKK